MTTIAADHRHMCGDTYNSITESGYYAAKIERVGTSLVGCAGPATWCSMFLAWRRGTAKAPKFTLDKPFEALVLDKTGLYVFYNDCIPDRLTSRFHAIGSGKQYALGALHSGATLHNAILAACAYDPYSKPPIQREKL